MRATLLALIAILTSCATQSDQAQKSCEINLYSGGVVFGIQGLIKLSAEFEQELRSLMPPNATELPVCWYATIDGGLIAETEKVGYLFTYKDEYWYFSGIAYEKVILVH